MKKTFKIDDKAIAFVFTAHRWGNRKTADKSKVETRMNKRMLNATKRLVDSIEYKRINSHIRETKHWVVMHSVPSFFQDGVFLFSTDMVETVEAYLASRRTELNALIDEFVSVYPAQIEQAKELLDDQFFANDYPTAEALRYRFGFNYQWISFDVPKSLPDDLYAIEKKKVEALWAQAAEQITMSLRASFQRLVTHVVERLTPEKGKKPKVIKDSVIDNINEFIESFRSRNLTNDKELADLIEKAQSVLNNVDGDSLRDERFVKLAVRKGFSQIEKLLDGMVVEKPGRKFDFEE